MPKISLTLTDDRQALKTVSVTEHGLQGAFEQLMAHLLEVHEDYDCGPFDTQKDMHSIIKADIRKALRRPVTKDAVLAFNTPECENGTFSIVWRWQPDDETE